MERIAIFHTKGGVGKSAVTVFLSDFISTLHGKRVLIVDLDPQGSTSRALLGRSVLDSGVKAGASLPRLLEGARSGEPSAKTVRASILSRPGNRGRATKRVHYLGRVDVLPTDRPGWRHFSDWASTVKPEHRGNYHGLLDDVLSAIDDDYDIALLDFPGSELPFWTVLGLRASGWWLLPELPDFMSTEDLDTAVGLVSGAQKKAPHTIRPLGTLLTICPNRGSSTYRRARSALEHLDREGAIPPLFPKDCEILHRPDAQKATDWKSESFRTLAQRYGGATGPFHVGLKKLARELLARLDPSTKPLRLPAIGRLRRMLTDYWRG